MTTKHAPATPLPWLATQGHIYPPRDDAPAIGQFASKQDARYGAHAANAYPRLVAAIKAWLPPTESEYGSQDAAMVALLRELGELDA